MVEVVFENLVESIYLVLIKVILQFSFEESFQDLDVAFVNGSVL